MMQQSHAFSCVLHGVTYSSNEKKHIMRNVSWFVTTTRSPAVLASPHWTHRSWSC